jgi:hypothetical protein
MDIEQMKHNFPQGIAVPDELERLCVYSEQFGEDLSCDFMLIDSGKESVLAGFDNVTEVVNQFLIFGRDGAHSLYGYWLYAGQGIEEAPIVYLNSEGCDCTVLANTLREFFILLALGKSSIGATFWWDEWDEETDEECEGIFEFRSWLKSEFGIDQPSEDEARAIVERAKKAHPDLDAWVTGWAEQHYS